MMQHTPQSPQNTSSGTYRHPSYPWACWRLFKDHVRFFLNSKRLMRDAAYRRQWSEIRYLRSIPRHTAVQTSLLNNQPMIITDSLSFLGGYNEIWKDEFYRFTSKTPQPVIIDCGANVGVAIAYWKALFPEAKITAFEADPAIFSILTRNIEMAGYSNVTAINAALWDAEGRVPFHNAGGLEGRVATSSQEKIINVRSVRLQDFLHEPVDLLKVDIEGSEDTVMRDSAPYLKNVRNLFVEFHEYVGEDSDIAGFLSFLSSHGFHYTMQAQMPRQKLYDVTLKTGSCRFTVNIFARREP